MHFIHRKLLHIPHQNGNFLRIILVDNYAYSHRQRYTNHSHSLASLFIQSDKVNDLMQTRMVKAIIAVIVMDCFFL